MDVLSNFIWIYQIYFVILPANLLSLFGLCKQIVKNLQVWVSCPIMRN